MSDVLGKTADTAVPIHPHLANRWSPRGFDRNYVVTDDELLSLLEAARWTASCANTQPWRFVIGRRGDATFQRIVENLKSYNKEWTPLASVLMVVCAQITDDDGKSQRWAEYDTGQAIAMMTVQAAELGLHVHQMGGLEVEAIQELFAIPEQFVPITAVAIGKLDPQADLSEVLAERERAPRQRLSIEELLITDPQQG